MRTAIRADGCAGDGLVHDGERVAHGAVAGLGQQGECGLVGIQLFVGRDRAQLPEDVVEAYGVEGVMLRPRADGLRDVLRLRGRHHEDDMVRRLFERLEQRVEGGVGDLVRLVEDVDLVAVARRAVAGGVAQLANLVDATIGGGVDLDDIDGRAGTNFGTGIADAAGLGRGALGGADRVLTVERHCQNAGDGGFADAAMTAEDVAVGNAALGQRIQQRARDVLLPDDIAEELGTVFAGENLVGHADYCDCSPGACGKCIASGSLPKVNFSTELAEISFGLVEATPVDIHAQAAENRCKNEIER